MSAKKEYYTDMFQWAMLALNGIAVAFLCTFIYVTTNKIPGVIICPDSV